MSRISLTPKNPDKHETVVCRYDDTPIGFFFQVFGQPGEDNEEVILINKDQMFTHGFSRNDMLELIKEYEVDDKITRHCLSQIAADEDPAIGLPQR